MSRLYFTSWAKCRIRVGQIFFQNCAQPHENNLYVLPHINPYLSTRQVQTSCFVLKFRIQLQGRERADKKSATHGKIALAHEHN